MADYYSLLAKAVSNLPKAGPEPARKAIYDRARKALVRQLRSLGPALSEADIAREEAALEAAIGKLEGQFSPTAPTPPSPAGARPSPTPPPNSAAPRPPSYAPPPRPAPPAAAPPSGARIPMPDTPLARPVPPPRSASPPPLSSERPSASGAPQRPSNAPSSAAPRALPAAPMGLRPPPAARYSPPLAARRTEPRYEPDSSPLGPPAADEFVDDGYAPPVEASKLERAEAVGAADVGLRPSAPQRLDRPRRGAAAWILAALVVGVVLAIAVFAFLWRQNPQDLAMKEPVATPTAEATASPAKIVERVGGATATPAAGETPLATETPAVAATPTVAATPAVVATPAATTSPAVSPAAAAAAPASTPAATTAPPAANSGVAVAARAAMLVAVAADPQKPAVSLGSVVWSTIPAAAGQPATVAVKAEADIPELKMHAVMTLRKNTDPSLPASHTIDLRVTFADGAEIKGIKDMRVPMMRRDDPPSQDALSGVRVKISDSYFLVGLNRGDAELAHNVDLIANRGWFDFPMLLNDDRIAKLTFEKGADGERIVNDALAAWK
jgi:hypothetical protein